MINSSKRLFNYVLTFVPHLTDSLLDALYFTKLEDDSNSYVHVPKLVLSTLAVFLALAVLKDITCNIWINEIIKAEIIQSLPCDEKDELDKENTVSRHCVIEL